MRFNLQPDNRFAALRDSLHGRVRDAANSVDASVFEDIFDPLMRLTARDAFDEVHADEGTVWLADRENKNLVPGYNTGPRASAIVKQFKQPLSRGLISLVFQNGQSFCENDVYRNAKQDSSLDQRLEVLTCGMIAVPLYFAMQVRGVISCVKLKANEDMADPTGFSPESIHRIERAAAVIGRLLDLSLVGTTVGWRMS